MGVEHRRARRRWLVVAVASAAVIVVAAVVIRTTVLRDRATAVPVDVAREQYRAEVGPTTTVVASTTAQLPPRDAPDEPQVPALVAPGVYRYETTGSESIDVLGGTTHSYPAETTITVTADGCGVRLRWDALVERRDEWRLCATPAGVELQPVALQYHEFFGQRDAEDLVCDRAVLLVPTAPTNVPPTAPTAGVSDRLEPVTQTCMLADDPWLATWEVIGTARRTVDGATVEVRHVRMTVDDDDEHWERTVVDWYLAGDGLPVEVVGSKESRSPSPIGAVVYREAYRLVLVSTVPLT